MELTTREQGDIGQLSAMMWLAEQGAKVYIPVSHSPDVDLVAEWDDQLARVQVKTSRHFVKGRWSVQLSTRGGNQSWNGTIKRFSPARCDLLFVLVGCGRR